MSVAQQAIRARKRRRIQRKKTVRNVKPLLKKGAK